jgi:hypothetical protein
MIEPPLGQEIVFLPSRFSGGLSNVHSLIRGADPGQKSEQYDYREKPGSYKSPLCMQFENYD